MDSQPSHPWLDRPGDSAETLAPATVADGPGSGVSETPSDVEFGPLQPNTTKRRITTLGDFRMGKKVGTGMMGAVYRARQISRGRDVAVKVLRTHLAKNKVFLERFRREAEVMARLSHPNVIRCYAVGKQYGRHYLAMELVEGDSLRDWLARADRLPVADAVHVLIACTKAVQHAHQNGLIHRDIKPENVLLTHEGQVKLGDFGLAMPLFGEEVAPTAPGVGAGTPLYIAPEQARDARAADARSDLYSLGCMLYHALTGTLPFRGESTLDIVRRKIDGSYAPAGEVNPEVPEALDSLLASLLAPHPDDRLQSATDLLWELEQLDLASSSLSFLAGQAPASPDDDGAGSVSESEDQLSRSLDSPPDAPGDDTAAAPEAKKWYVLHPRDDGRWQRRRWTTAQIKQALLDDFFALNAQVSRHRGDYRPLADFPEFRAALGEKFPDLFPAQPPIPALVDGRLFHPLLGFLLVLLTATLFGLWFALSVLKL